MPRVSVVARAPSRLDSDLADFDNVGLHVAKRSLDPVF
jgi:hypothetical protein